LADGDFVRFGDIFRLVDERVGDYEVEPEVLSVTKHRGIVRAVDFFKNRVASRDLAKYKRVRPGYFAYSTIHIDEGAIAKNHLPFEGVVSPMYTVMEFIGPDELVDVDFIEFLLRTPHLIDEYKARSGGSVHRRQSLPFAKFAEINVELPLAARQKALARVLREGDALVEKMAAHHETTDILLRSLQERLLVPLGTWDDLPSDWELSTLDRVANVRSGITKGRKPKAALAPKPFLRAANVQDGFLDLAEIHSIDVTADEAERFQLHSDHGQLIYGGNAELVVA
jgi:restriction endonuclease S subunit